MAFRKGNEGALSETSSPWEAHDFLDHVLDVLRAEQHPFLMDISQQPVLSLRYESQVKTLHLKKRADGA